MAKIIRLTENDLTELVKRVIKETTNEGPKQRKYVRCSELGVKSPGFCDLKRKMPVDYCSKLGVKTPGVCYVDTKQPVP